MKFLKSKVNYYLFSVMTVFFPVVTFAQNVTIKNPIKSTSFIQLVKTILEGVIKIGIPFIALAIIYCGFLLVSAEGKPEEIKKAKSSLVYTLIGSALLLGAWTIVQILSETVRGL